MHLIAAVGLADVATHLWDHWGDVFAGATALGIAAHALNSFPVPQNKYGQWILGILQFAVGQRFRAANTIQGDMSRVISMGSVAATDQKQMARGVAVDKFQEQVVKNDEATKS